MEQVEFVRVRCFLQGDRGVGKTSLCWTHNSRQFPHRRNLDFTYESLGQDVEVEDGRRVTLQYMEVPTVGDLDISASLPDLSYKWCDVCLMCFSLVNPHTYETILEDYYAHFTKWRFDVPIVVVGLKNDLVDDADTLALLRASGETPLTHEDGVRLAETINAASYVDCSSLSGQGVDHVFHEARAAALGEKKSHSKRLCSIM